MYFPRRYFFLLPLMIAINLFTVSCTADKASQCNKIIKVANQVASKATAVINNGQRDNAKETLEATDAMEKASKEMAALTLKDEKLKNYQTRYIKMYGEISKSTRDFIGAYEKKDRPAAEKALKKLDEAASQEPKLVDEINIYCTAK
jgi:predicted translin family RNA/ssDNA-binding protein